MAKNAPAEEASLEDALALEMERTFEAIEIREMVADLRHRALNDHFDRQSKARARMCTPIQQITLEGYDLYEAMKIDTSGK